MKALFTSHYRLLLFTGVALVAMLAATPATAGVRTCDGRPATIQRGDGDNNITGTNGNDVIVAGGGDDDIEPSPGRDRICGEGGNDIADAGSGSDPLVSGGPGRDLMHGGPGNDEVVGGDGGDGGTAQFRGAPIPAGLFGDAGDDLVAGGPGDDGNPEAFVHGGLDGGPGDDDLVGGAGADDIDDRTGPDTADAADVDRVFDRGGGGDISVLDGDGDDEMFCRRGAGANRVSASGGTGTLAYDNGDRVCPPR